MKFYCGVLNATLCAIAAPIAKLNVGTEIHSNEVAGILLPTAHS